MFYNPPTSHSHRAATYPHTCKKPVGNQSNISNNASSRTLFGTQAFTNVVFIYSVMHMHFVSDFRNLLAVLRNKLKPFNKYSLQWLNCKQISGECSLPFPFFPPLPFPAMKWLIQNQLGVWGCAVSSLSEVGGDGPAENAFQCIFSLKIASAGNIFFYKCPKKKTCIGNKCHNGIQEKVAEHLSGTSQLNLSTDSLASALQLCLPK